MHVIGTYLAPETLSVTTSSGQKWLVQELILIGYAPGMAEAGYRLVREGQARVLVRIQSSELGILAGSRVLEGQVSKNSHVKIVRNHQVLWAGRIRRLQPAGETGSPASAGHRCTIAFDGFEAFKAGDSVEAFQLEPGSDRCRRTSRSLD